MLVSNAAFQMTHSDLEEISDEEWDYTFRLNVGAYFHLLKAALPHMGPGSSVIGSSSVNSDSPSPTLAPYAATKAAIANFSASLAQLLGEKGIRVNSVAPGPIWTPLIPATMPERRSPISVTTHRWAERANPPSLRPCTYCWPPTKAVTSPARGWRSPAADPSCERVGCLGVDVAMNAAPTIGVEEEFLLLDPETRAPIPVAERVIGRAATSLGDLVSGEFARQQLEVKTPPCADAAQLRNELLRLRRVPPRRRRDEGVRICATGTPVIAAPGRLEIGDHPRYRAGLAQYRAMLDDFSVCAVHVHIHLPDRETAVLTGNHLRPWLPLLVALSANSPFHEAKTPDTGAGVP